MNIIKKIIFALVLLAVPFMFADAAANPKITSATYGDNVVKVNGTLTWDDGATIEVVVFDGSTPVLMGTTELKSNAYSYTSPSITLDSTKSYKVMISSHDGACQTSKVLTKVSSINPQTWDDIYTYIIIGIIAVIGIGIGIFYLIKTKKNKEEL